MVVVTGASGFIGSRLTTHLLENNIVYAIARRSRRSALIHHHINLKSQVVWISFFTWPGTSIFKI